MHVNKTFNSLFEMQEAASPPYLAPGEAFNSLFEMQLAWRPTETSWRLWLRFQFSIWDAPSLEAKKRSTLAASTFQFSIWDARLFSLRRGLSGLWAFNSLFEMLTTPAMAATAVTTPFNSLFEMRWCCSMATTRWGSLSILYLRCISKF